MTNDEIAMLFSELADIMEIAGENFFKILSYRKAADSIRGLGKDLSEMTEREIESMPGVGRAIFEKIQSAVKTGSFPTLEKWRATDYGGLKDLLGAEGVTPRKLSNLLKSLRIDSLDDIKKMIDKGEFQKLDIIDGKVRDGILKFISKTRQ